MIAVVVKQAEGEKYVTSKLVLSFIQVKWHVRVIR
jgi:hypothetical protein